VLKRSVARRLKLPPVLLGRAEGFGISSTSAMAALETLLAANDCRSCHAVDKTVVGPAYKAVAAKYAHVPDAEATVEKSIRAGGAGKWGPVPMPPYGQLSEEQARSLARYVLSQ